MRCCAATAFHERASFGYLFFVCPSRDRTFRHSPIPHPSIYGAMAHAPVIAVTCTNGACEGLLPARQLKLPDALPPVPLV